MVSAKLIRTFGLNAVAMVVGAVIAASCVNVDYPTVAFRCNPRQSDNCPDAYLCCSDDASTLGGDRLFSGFNNSLSATGMCVKDGAIPVGSGLTENPACPVPCNPTWDVDTVTAACGANRVCCQTVEITELDCVLDGESYRPATGNDIFNGLTDWSNARHDTHQDPSGTVCLELGGGDQNSETFKNCARALTVANQRGFCMQLGPGQGCPTQAPTYIDACNQKNQLEGRPFHNG